RSDGTNTEIIKVPLSYAPRARFRQRLAADQKEGTEVEVSLPRMSFEWTDISYDSARKLNTMQRMVSVNSSDATKLDYRWQRVPYELTFNVGIYTTNTEDGLKIIEQILPFFTPELTVTINDVVATDVPIVLTGVSQEDTWEGGFPEERRYVVWTLDFSVKTYLYGPSKTSKVITEVITQLYTNDNLIVLTMNSGGSKDYRIGETVYQGDSYTDSDVQGIVENWNSPTYKLTVKNVLGNFTTSKKVIGMDSKAEWILSSSTTGLQDTQTSLETANVRITQVPDPTSADADDEYNVTTTLTKRD
ncbi:uncharacterized protein METZ01_LOCUS158490, partial [marine metagenome]